MNNKDFLNSEEMNCEVSEPMNDYLSEELNDLTYKIIGCSMDVHSTIGRGFLESVYKECLKIEFERKNICFDSEKKYDIFYKGIKLPQIYKADFVINNELILEIKAQQNVIEENIKQTLNYMAVSKCKVGLLINFGENSLKYKRLVLSK